MVWPCAWRPYQPPSIALRVSSRRVPVTGAKRRPDAVGGERAGDVDDDVGEATVAVFTLHADRVRGATPARRPSPPTTSSGWNVRVNAVGTGVPHSYTVMVPPADWPADHDGRGDGVGCRDGDLQVGARRGRGACRSARTGAMAAKRVAAAGPNVPCSDMSTSTSMFDEAHSCRWRCSSATSACAVRTTPGCEVEVGRGRLRTVAREQAQEPAGRRLRAVTVSATAPARRRRPR